MSTAVSVAPLLGGRVVAELVGGPGVGLVLLDERGDVRAGSELGAELLRARWRDDLGAALPELSVLARQVLRGDTPATLPVVVDGAPVRRLWAELQPVDVGGERLVLLVLRPVSTDVLRGKGLFDPLTGLVNRVLLFDRIDQALRRGRVHGTTATLVLADLRGLGRLDAEAGDRLLTLVAGRLVRGLSEDRTVARYSGGTFAVLSEDGGVDGGDGFAARVRELVGHPARVGWACALAGDTVCELVGRAQESL